jgi:predicted transposase YdaD
MLNYKEQLQHPLWQRKRLEILQRDNFTCLNCKETEVQLQIHHLIYIKDLHAWEYPNSLLLTLCKDCHEAETEQKFIILLALSLFKDICSLSNLSISQLSYIYPDIYDMQEKDDYEYNEAFKIALLKIINPS